MSGCKTERSIGTHASVVGIERSIATAPGHGDCSAHQIESHDQRHHGVGGENEGTTASVQYAQDLSLSTTRTTPRTYLVSLLSRFIAVGLKIATFE
ncbi:glycoside hydrolase [Pseudozyma hubeiensis SY62]|uniref:Glycoside hydrolase n=1 Tax=Pseudozyma hubeiensis (strain SY62) TaxID=1305764 RepID=R9P0D3_PSEHS|nr:glycoside hydrolase [Pseudozyma hubeiensis SY62]GAC94591.1 glycoside hydrolase [Pseudozyma hubeiensis SY62]